VGIIVAIFGGLIALGSLFMDTTVQTTLGGRVHNIGLQQQQIMGLLLGLAMLLVGTIVALLSKKNSAANQTNLVANQVKTADEISLYLAKNQKYLIWVLCLQFATGLILVLAPQLGGLIALITFVAQVVFVFQIALVVFPGILGAVLATASLVPFFGLLVIAFINSAATAILEKNGVKVSFWGVPKDELTRLESKFQKSEKTNRSW
jgi:hypothetical protein